MIIQSVIMDDAYNVIEKCTFRGNNASEKMINYLNEKYEPQWYIHKFIEAIDNRWYNKNDKHNV